MNSISGKYHEDVISTCSNNNNFLMTLFSNPFASGKKPVHSPACYYGAWMTICMDDETTLSMHNVLNRNDEKMT
jgi:hypothetical protein